MCPTDWSPRANDPQNDGGGERGLLRVGKREETVDAEDRNDGRQQGSQPIAGPQPSPHQEGAEDTNEGVDELKNEGTGHATYREMTSRREQGAVRSERPLRCP